MVVKDAVRSAPQAVGSQVHANLENLSPDKQIPFDSRSQNSVALLVLTQQQEIMEERVSGICIDGTEGREIALFF